MAHISSIGAGFFSDLSLASYLTNLTPTLMVSYDTQSEFEALFATEQAASATPVAGDFVRIVNVREFPSMGTPPNIVNIPGFGSKTSQQIQGQADAPTMELTLNYVPSEWALTATNVQAVLLATGQQTVFRFTLLNAEPTSATASEKYASTTAGLGSVANTSYYWKGKVEALQVNPQLTDATTATLTLTLQSAFYGAFTV